MPWITVSNLASVRLSVKLDPEIVRFLECQRTAGLATVDAKGRPCACNVRYAMDKKGRLYFVSRMDSAHGRQIVGQPMIAMTIYGDADDPMDIHGLQIRGHCTPLLPPPEGAKSHWNQAWTLYAEKYPFVAENELFKQAVWTQCFYRLTPTWMRWLDNRKGFGFKVEFHAWPKGQSGRSPTAGGKPKKKAAASKKA